MKAIFVEQTSCSGDSHEMPIATFSDDKHELMERILVELKADAEMKGYGKTSFSISDYVPESIAHNPESIDEII